MTGQIQSFCAQWGEYTKIKQIIETFDIFCIGQYVGKHIKRTTVYNAAG